MSYEMCHYTLTLGGKRYIVIPSIAGATATPLALRRFRHAIAASAAEPSLASRLRNVSSSAGSVVSSTCLYCKVISSPHFHWDLTKSLSTTASNEVSGRTCFTRHQKRSPRMHTLTNIPGCTFGCAAVFDRSSSNCARRCSTMLAVLCHSVGGSCMLSQHFTVHWTRMRHLITSLIDSIPGEVLLVGEEGGAVLKRDVGEAGRLGHLAQAPSDEPGCAGCFPLALARRRTTLHRRTRHRRRRRLILLGGTKGDYGAAAGRCGKFWSRGAPKAVAVAEGGASRRSVIS